MTEEADQKWLGLGRWLSLAVAITLLCVAALSIVRTNDASAGWNLLLGAMLGGVVLAGDRRAPNVAAVVSVIMIVRVAVGLVLGSPVDAVASSVVALAALLGTWDLFRQRRTRDEPYPRG